MGLIRLLLALAVVVAHSEPLLGFKLTGGRVAVEAFFIISGFYMGMILNEKYSVKRNSYKLFISNRLLRIFPIYWAVLVGTIVVFLMTGFLTGKYGGLQVYLNNVNSIGFTSLAFLITSNILILGQDFFLFLKANAHGGLDFANNIHQESFHIYRFALIPQAWSISLELLFYFIAPLLFRMKNYFLFVIFILSLGGKYFAYQIGYNYDPWNYRFFPFELSYFIAGLFSYKTYLTIANKSISNKIPYVAFCYIVLFILFFDFLGRSQIKDSIFLISMVITTHYIFILSKNNKIDRIIGEFSYPIYLCHFLILIVLIRVMQVLKIQHSFTSELCTVFSVFFSFLLINVIGDKIERLRVKRFITTT